MNCMYFYSNMCPQGLGQVVVFPCFSRYSGDGEAQQARCFCVGVRERNYYMATGLKGVV